METSSVIRHSNRLVRTSSEISSLQFLFVFSCHFFFLLHHPNRVGSLHSIRCSSAFLSRTILYECARVNCARQVECFDGMLKHALFRLTSTISTPLFIISIQKIFGIQLTHFLILCCSRIACGHYLNLYNAVTARCAYTNKDSSQNYKRASCAIVTGLKLYADTNRRKHGQISLPDVCTLQKGVVLFCQLSKSCSGVLLQISHYVLAMFARKCQKFLSEFHSLTLMR